MLIGLMLFFTVILPLISDRSIGIRKTIHDVCTVVQDMLKEVKNTAIIQILVGFCRSTRQCAARIRLFRLIKAQKIEGRCAPPHLYRFLPERLMINRKHP